MKITIQASQANLTAEEIKRNLTPNQLQKVKGRKLAPYIIAEEGESRPRVIGEGSRVLNWSRNVIQAIKDKVQTGTKLYKGHNADNSTTGRKSVGEVITTIAKEVGGKLQTIAIACMTNIDEVLDVCSIEADVYEENGAVTGVDRITGIAVANSAVEQPAFSNARRLATVQCFNVEEEPQQLGDRKNMDNITLDQLINVPLDMFKQAAKIKDIHPAQIFGLNDLENDREFGSLIRDKKEALEKAESLSKEISDWKSKYEGASKDLLRTNAKSKLDSLLPENITDSQKIFIEKRFKAEKFDDLEESTVKGYINKELEEYPEYAKMFGGGESTDNNIDPADNNDAGDLNEEQAFEKEFENL